MQIHGHVVSRLTPHRQNQTLRLLNLVDVHDRLERELLKVQLVTHVIIGAHRLRIVIDHDGLKAQRLELIQTAHAAPVKLHRAPDAVHPGAQHHDQTLVKVVQIMLGSVVGQIQVVGFAGPLGGDGVDFLDARYDLEALADGAHLELRALAVGRDLFVREADLLASVINYKKLLDTAGA